MPDRPACHPVPTAADPPRRAARTARAPARAPVLLDSAAPSLAERFAARGHELALVGGPVRDAMLGRTAPDLDFTTDARPTRPSGCSPAGPTRIWDIGRAFGTIGAAQGRARRSRSRPTAPSPTTRTSRKPEVAFGDTLEGDLRRRDFTVNAMAVRAAGAASSSTRTAGWPTSRAGVLRTPGTPEESFADDPLRMMRAARFAAQLGFDVGPEVRRGDDRRWPTGSRSSRPSGSATSWSSCCCAPHPRRGLRAAGRHRAGRRTCCPSCRRCALEIDEHHRHKDVYEHTLTVLEQAIDLEDRLPGARPGLRARASPRCMHDVGKPRDPALRGRRRRSPSTTTRWSAPS